MSDRRRSLPGSLPRLSRRQLLGGGLAGAALLLDACSSGTSSAPSTTAASAGRSTVPPVPTSVVPRIVKQAGTRPRPALAAGTDLLPEIEHVVVVMMENHSFDNILGTSGRGDGFTIGRDGLPTNSNPDGHGNRIRAFHMPDECQNKSVENDWTASHLAFDGGKMDGFVTGSTAEAMGYFDHRDLPFTLGMAEAFPVADRYFCSVLADTYPNRRYLLAATSLGLITDTFPTELPPNGIIFQTLDRYGISWKDYYSTTPSVGIFLPLLEQPSITDGLVKIDEFYADAAAGTLPAVSLVEPDYGVSSEEDPQDVQFGDQFMAKVVNAVMSGPKWSSTLLIWTYDEHGGYYDHVPPPLTVTPDDVPPDLKPGNPTGGFGRYGFRVPAGVVSPYARREYVSHTVYDHTSILATIEAKWNLPALTRRDANANTLLDMLDLRAAPAFATPPRLPAPPDPELTAGCLTTGAGTIPPPSAVIRE